MRQQEIENRLKEQLQQELGAMVMAGLQDDTVLEILLNADGHLWFERMGAGMQDTGQHFTSVPAESLIRTVAGLLDTEVSKTSPQLEVELPFDGSRFTAIRNDLTIKTATVI